MSSAESRVYAALRYARGVLAALILCVLVLFADPKALVTLLLSVKFVPTLLLFLFSFVLLSLSVLKWRYLIMAFGRRVPITTLFSLYLVGYFVNSFLPSQVGGDIARSVSLSKSVGRKESFAATLLERYTGLLAMLFLALVSVSLGHGPGYVLSLIVLGFCGIIGVGTGLVLSSASWRVLSRFMPSSKLRTTATTFRDALLSVALQPKVVVITMLFSVLFHLCTAVNTLIAAYAIGWDSASFASILIVLPFILLVGALPLTPSGIGVQEGAFFFFLTQIGASPSHALCIAALLRVKVLFVGIIGGLVWACGSIRGKETSGK